MDGRLAGLRPMAFVLFCLAIVVVLTVTVLIALQHD
jgi:hypothetical protein